MARNRKKKNPDDRSTDDNLGNEGVNDPAMGRTHLDEIQAADRQGGASSGEQMRKSSKQHSTRGQDNDRQQGRESTDNNSSSFSGQGDQREGAENPEGTGYTNDK